MESRSEERRPQGAVSPRGFPVRLVALLLVAVLVIPGIVFAALLLQRFARAELGRVDLEAREVAATAAAVIDRQLRSWQATLQTLADSDALAQGDFATFYRQAANAKRFLGADIGLRSPEGQQLVNTRLPWGQPLPLTPFPLDAEVIRTRRPMTTDVFTGAVAARPLVAQIVPVVIRGEVRYLLHVSAETDLLNAALAEVVPRDWIVGVGDRKGIYVARSRDHDAFTGKPGLPAFLDRATGPAGTFSGTGATGDAVLVGYVRSPVSGWLVAANIPQALVTAPARQAVLELALFGVLALAVAGLIALWLWRTVARPLRALTRASAALGRDPAPIAAPTRLREFAALRDAMSDAARQIASHNAGLEARVEARTRELAETNHKLRREIEQRTRVEAMLTQAQKMEAIGSLTGGVAHDFNNLLQVVGGNLQLLVREVSGNDRAMKRIDNALAGVERGAKLASQLLAFGRRQPLAPKVVNVGSLVLGLHDLLRRTLGEAVEVEIVLAPGLWNTLADPGQIENALLNLAINARDAMAGQGRLTMEAGNAVLDADYAAARGGEPAPGEYVEIAVSDTGAGMDAEVLGRAFEPFFSTKPPGQGSGLGLSMVYGFARQSGGHVAIYSEPGHGTTVRLYLPRSTQAETAPDERESGPVIGGSETVLVVEDDDAVRDTVVALLGDLGYRVLRAPDARAALAVVESGVAIDLLFTDVVMPGTLKSPELARLARRHLPNLRVLFTSGYTENSIVHSGRLDEGVELLSKPYTREALARRIRQVLGRPPRSLPETMPQPEPPVPAPAAEAEPAGLAPGRSLTVLVVEDDAIIRMDTVDMVAELGYAVIEAESGARALEAAAGREIDVLLTDVGLPDISGGDLARRLRAERPGIAVVFATGRDAVEGFEAQPRTVLLKKPYRLHTLGKTLADVLS